MRAAVCRPETPHPDRSATMQQNTVTLSQPAFVSGNLLLEAAAERRGHFFLFTHAHEAVEEKGRHKTKTEDTQRFRAAPFIVQAAMPAAST